MSHQLQLLLALVGGAFVVGVIVTLMTRKVAAKNKTGKKRRSVKAKTKRTAGSRQRKRAVAVRRAAIDNGTAVTYRDLPGRTANARDVAAYIVQKIGPLTPMKLNRLVAISQAAAIAEDGRPIFQDTVAASPTGPIPTMIFNEHACKSEIAAVPEGDIEMIVPKAQERIDAVLERCGSMDEHDLNRLTCTSPWRNARSRAVSGGGDPVIEHKELADVWKMIADRLAA